MRLLKQSTAANVMVFMTDASDHVTGKASLTLAVTASKDGAAFASIAPTVTERGSGWYSIALTTSHVDTLGDLALHVTGSGADPTDLICRVVAGALDADVSSRAATTLVDTVEDSLGTLMSRLTGQRAVNLDNLDATVSSRFSGAGYVAPDNTGIADLLFRLSATRADALDYLDAAITSRSAPGDAMGLTAEGAELVWEEVIELAYTAREFMRLFAAACAGKASGLDLNVPAYRDLGDTKNRIAASTDASGNRATVSLDLS